MEQIKQELNIRPEAGILGVFSRLNYKPWYAIAEFVDNSTASYLGHKKTFKFYRIKKITIKIEYDAFLNELKIIDDAYGMDINDFKRAVLLDQKPDNLNGRNEFGMGLKTAASWFGEIWSVESTRLNSPEKYFAEVNIPKLKEEKKNTIDIITTKTDPLSHGTTIRIKNITKKITSPKTKSKIKDLLESMYRRDISRGDIEIYFNGEKLSFEPFKILNFRNNEWKKDLDFSFEFEGKPYHVTGFVGIMEKGGYDKAGFALFRYDRAIKGCCDESYKPYEIFGQAQSQISLKLFGEFNMEDFPVNQAKDGFVWDDGLEEAFLAKLKKEIKDYIEIASMSKIQRAQEEEISNEESEKTQEIVSNVFDQLVLDDENEENTDLGVEPANKEIRSDVEKFIIEQTENNNSADTEFSCQRDYTIKLDQITEKTFHVFWKIGSDDCWLEYDEENSNIIININHPFFKPYSTTNEFKTLLEQFVVSFICAEELSIKAAKILKIDGYISPDVFRNKINNILKKIGIRK